MLPARTRPPPSLSSTCTAGSAMKAASAVACFFVTHAVVTHRDRFADVVRQFDFDLHGAAEILAERASEALLLRRQRPLVLWQCELEQALVSQLASTLCRASSRAIAASGSRLTSFSQSPSKSRANAPPTAATGVAANYCSRRAGRLGERRVLRTRHPGWWGRAGRGWWPGARRWIRRSSSPLSTRGGEFRPCNVAGVGLARGLHAPFDGANASKRKNVIISAVCSSGARRRSSRPCSAIW